MYKNYGMKKAAATVTLLKLIFQMQNNNRVLEADNSFWPHNPSEV